MKTSPTTNSSDVASVESDVQCRRGIRQAGTQNVRTLGILGGLAPDVTTIYYDRVVRRYRSAVGDGSYPRILINSVDLKQYLEIFAGEPESALTGFLSTGLESLVQAGADVALIAANSPHLVFEDLRQRVPIPLISIVDSVAEAAQRLNLRKVGLLGNRFTMQSGVYQRRFATRGISLITPNRREQEYIIEKYTSDFATEDGREASNGLFARVAFDLIRQSDIDGLIVGGCEQRPLFTEPMPIPILNSVELHTEAALRAMLPHHLFNAALLK